MNGATPPTSAIISNARSMIRKLRLEPWWCEQTRPCWSSRIRATRSISFAMLGELLEATIRNLQDATAIDRKVELGLAVAAHELRAPLLAARVVLEHELTRPRRPSDRLLLRTADELTRLSDQLDLLLRWSTSPAPLVLGKVDASALLREAIEACTPPFGRDRVRLRAAEGVMVAADAGEPADRHRQCAA